MVWPITGAESYVGETGKSMKAMEFAVAQEDGWRNIPITLIEPLTGVLALSPGCVDYYRRYNLWQPFDSDCWRRIPRQQRFYTSLSCV
jgi:hypothetical protein